MTGYTVVEQPSPWDDQQRGRMLGLAQYWRDIHKCGVHDAIRRDPNNVFVPDEDTCPLCAAIAMQERIKQDEDARFNKQLPEHPDPWIPRPKDGRSLFLRPATEAELIERARQAAAKRRR